jgi:hypothetical protein
MGPRCFHRGNLVGTMPKSEPPSFFNGATSRASWKVGGSAQIVALRERSANTDPRNIPRAPKLYWAGLESPLEQSIGIVKVEV